ncbi:MAG: SDR family oxidoreductase [Nitrospinae bacterium]|nr:SDR family oxidoreductase [Nitrospinota bacterium]MZH06035.1 SDR family oxidoreductase [Nitrospinota bacterium]MZH14068.1 SDR family oxidoreductase [Nitrospinota bacterium]
MPTAIITGGAIRIGKAMALHLAGKGFSIALHYNQSNPSETIDEIKSRGVRCLEYPCDLTKIEEAEQLIARVIADFNDVELLINSAANFIQENLEETHKDTLASTLHLNLMSPYLLMRDYKRSINKGMIVNIIDERVRKHISTFAAYSVSKVGLKHLTELAAVEWGETVRVNGIAPGLILPPQGGAPDYLEKAAEKVPTRTHGNMENLLQALDYLLENQFVNGDTLFVDGGESWLRS